MNRKLGTMAIAVSSLSVWLVSASACSGGGGGTVASDDPDTASVPADTDGEPPDRTLSPDEAPAPSPFEPAAPSEPVGEGGNADADFAAVPPAEPSTTDDGPDMQRPIGDGTDTAAISGLWQHDRTTDLGTDVALFAIDDDGGLTEYDFQGDDVGSGVDCHAVARSAIAARGNDRYDIQDSITLPGSGSIDDVLITADGSEITFRYLGTAADPQSGGNLTGITERYPAVTDRTVDDLVICES